MGKMMLIFLVFGGARPFVMVSLTSVMISSLRLFDSVIGILG